MRDRSDIVVAGHAEDRRPAYVISGLVPRRPRRQRSTADGLLLLVMRNALSRASTRSAATSERVDPHAGDDLRCCCSWSPSQRRRFAARNQRTFLFLVSTASRSRSPTSSRRWSADLLEARRQWARRWAWRQAWDHVLLHRASSASLRLAAGPRPITTTSRRRSGSIFGRLSGPAAELAGHHHRSLLIAGARQGGSRTGRARATRRYASST